MKQLVQSYRTGELGIFEAPQPACHKGGILVRTTVSLVSSGTEKMVLEIARKSLLGKASARPDLLREVINKMKREGIRNTVEKVFSKLDTPVPLGYSCAGVVIDTGRDVTGVSAGDRVACGGAGYASHAGINYVPKNLFVKVPGNVNDREASFVTVGAIALQGVRQAQPTLGENIAVIGLGLIGQLTVQLLKANGCNVLGSDIDQERTGLARELGADVVCMPCDLVVAASQFSGGRGIDAVIITASTRNNQPVIDAGEICRIKGRVVVSGMVGMDIPRNIYYKKELDIRLSTAYGPGRYDPGYEEQGIDYPFGYVRWTERRNFEAFLNLVSQGKVNPEKLITHRFGFDTALKAYDLLTDKKSREKYLGIILEYEKPGTACADKKTIRLCPASRSSDACVNIGLIGAGNFARSVLLPHLRRARGYALGVLCASTGISALATGKKYGFKSATTDGEEIFADVNINAVMIATRHNTHASYALKALKARKHVFVEKPLCITELELEEIKKTYLGLAESAGAVPLLMVGFNRRFSPLVKRMREAICAGPVSMVYRVNAGIVPAAHWIQDGQTGGGRIIGEVCHFIDTCSYLAGSHPISVYAGCVRNTGNFGKGSAPVPDEDNSGIFLSFENGSTALISYTAYGNRQLPKEYIEVLGNDLAMQMNDFRTLTVMNGNSKRRYRNFNQDKGFKGELEAFRKAVSCGIPPIGFDSLYSTTKTAFAILKSIRTGKPVHLASL